MDTFVGILRLMSLQEQATRRSGVKQDDAFKIDEVNLFQRLGLDTFIKLSTNFYARYVSRVVRIC